MKAFEFDPSLNILYKEQHNLDYFFNPKTIAIIGASDKPNSVGRVILENLIHSNYKDKIFVVNNKKQEVLGYKSYPNIKKVPVKTDLVVIAIPAQGVPDIIAQCAEIEIPAAVIISAGFKELGEKGLALEKEIFLKKKKMRIIGPNCLGIMTPSLGLNATFASDIALKGSIAFISQSGALGTAILDWSLKEKIGFSGFVSIGSMIDVDWGDLINYFGNDPNTKSILIYMENIRNAKSFLSAAREVALTKPIILIKAGKTQESMKAAQSHTGALMGSDEVLNSALKRVGVLRVDTIEDLFGMAEIFTKQPTVKGRNLAIVTNAGGPAVIATDALILSNGKLARLQDRTIEALNQFLPSSWSHNNPVDILGDATAEIYYNTVKVLLKDENVDGILVILTPQFMTHPTEVANKLKELSIQEKPILASWMGAKSVEEGINILSKSNIVTFAYPDFACNIFSYMSSYSYNLAEIYETPKIYTEINSEEEIQKREKIVLDIFNEARKEKRTILNEIESKKILQTFNIKTVETYLAETQEEAANLAKKIGFPVVLKLFSKKITHKTDVGGVKLNLKNEQEVKDAFFQIQQSLKALGKEKDFDGASVQAMIQSNGYELILGSFLDKEFGPCILFGLGGQLVEIINDAAIALPPLSITLAKKLIKKTKIYQALKGFRGKQAVNLNLLAKTIVNFSNLIVQNPQIKECDINPLKAIDDNIIALDARIIIHEKEVSYSSLAIRPYPNHYIEKWQLRNKQKVTIRPICPDDELLIKDFFKEVSEKSLKQRYLKTLHYDEITAHERLIRICFIDYDREIALIVENTKKEILAIGRLTKLINSNEATFSLLVKDKWQKQGIGQKLLTNIIQIAKKEKINTLFSQMFEDNLEMKKICQNLGFSFEKVKDRPLIVAKLKDF